MCPGSAGTWGTCMLYVWTSFDHKCNTDLHLLLSTNRTFTEWENTLQSLSK